MIWRSWPAQPTQHQTNTVQVKADLWLLPNLNVFAAVGKIDGTVNLDVDIDLDAFLPPPICRPMDPCGVKRLNFDARVDAQTGTIGATAVHGFDNWYVSASLSRSVTISNKEASNVRATSAGLRLGRRWIYGRGNLLSPYLGAAYLDLDETITGVARAPGAFPDGDRLEVRYRAKLKNQDQWSGVLGLNIGLLSGLSFQGEYNKSSNSERFQLSTTYRF